MGTVMRLALWFVAGMLAGLALIRFMFIEFDCDDEEECDDSDGNPEGDT